MGYRQNACTGKQGLTPELARTVATKMRRRRQSEEAGVSAYHCAACGLWHVGSTSPARRKMPKQVMRQIKAKDDKRLDRQERVWTRGSRS